MCRRVIAIAEYEPHVKLGRKKAKFRSQFGAHADGTDSRCGPLLHKIKRALHPITARQPSVDTKNRFTFFRFKWATDRKTTFDQFVFRNKFVNLRYRPKEDTPNAQQSSQEKAHAEKSFQRELRLHPSVDR